ncbi:MAG: response regulator [Ignavibacteriales bacterium]|nr:MAG: response regulator [Ignavibacteriales bacterium]
MKTKILLIEDDENVRKGIHDLLREEGFEVVSANNGKDGIIRAKHFLPDLILSDIMMPLANGYQVLEELQKDQVTATIPFIFLTAKTEIDELRHGMSLGADDYIFKPYKADDLISAINTRLSKTTKVEACRQEMSDNILKSLPHELRTPLVSILGFSQLIKESCTAMTFEEISDMGGKINEAGNQLLSIVQKYLNICQIDLTMKDRKELSKIKNKNTRETEATIKSIVQAAASKFGRDADVEFNLTEHDLRIAEDYFGIMIEEIINNACKFSKAGTKININSFIKNNSYYLSIKDHGIGFTKEQLSRIGLLRQFDREKNFQSGLGMGLALVKKIAEMHECRIEISSEAGEYTSVELEIPILPVS